MNSLQHHIENIHFKEKESISIIPASNDSPALRKIFSKSLAKHLTRHPKQNSSKSCGFKTPIKHLTINKTERLTKQIKVLWCIA